MKIILLVIVGILFWTSDDARNFTANQLNNAEIVRPDINKNSFTIVMKQFYQVTHIEFDFDGEDLKEVKNTPLGFTN